MTDTMSTRWTAGPWTLGASGIHSYDARGRQTNIVAPAGALGCAWGETEDEATANATLIAAAPALYEALKHAVAIIRKYVPEDALGMNQDGGGDMDAALKAAEGEQP